jgi:hypothetical protein
VALVANRHGRDAVYIDASEAYLRLAQDRLGKESEHRKIRRTSRSVGRKLPASETSEGVRNPGSDASFVQGSLFLLE